MNRSFTFFLGILLLMLSFRLHAQKCDPLPETYYKINKTNLKVGDTVVFTITNISKKSLYYLDCDPGSYFLYFDNKSGQGKSSFLGKTCLTDTVAIILKDILKPGESFTIKCALPKKGKYLFIFNTSKALKRTQKWRCVDIDLYAN